jgi:tetraacyldisaccharide-1-P 4'-kinase
VSCSDAVVSSHSPPGIGALRFFRATAVGNGAHMGDAELGWPDLRSRNVGVWTSVARPGRILALLALHGITPRRVVNHADHAIPTRRSVATAAEAARELGLDLWLCTAKCHAALGEALPNVAVLDHALALEPALERALRVAAGL